MTRVLITGGAGFIGAHLARACVAADETVFAMVRPQTDIGRLAEFEQSITLIRGDARQTEALERAIAQARPDIIYHLAACTRTTGTSPKAPMRSVEEVLTPVLRLIEAARQANPRPKAIIRAGTIAEYPNSTRPVAETAREKPRDPYGAAAAAATHYLEMLAPDLPFRAITARLALVYGSGQSQSFFVPWAIRQALGGGPITLKRPYDRRDLLHVDDALSGLRQIARNADTAPLTLNISTGRAHRMDDVARTIARLCRDEEEPLFCEPDLRDGEEAVSLCADPALAKQRIGWTASIDLEDGLRRTVAWERRKLAWNSNGRKVISASRY
jgi:nucleoside-diphosphate-sugar epimerase